ncbi:hypothetical protein C8A05DRAFT_37699 [Staphylotrichum tortipilum]|uniref:LysM domain-containing protein n=1 Tax=Staphylotrichum tortipilum TaxID=2831512 RepID=A0AAN6RPY8_9PEZI|nr:hypothetical protein C8A05DRAFT_37699 [Staphylotrichum longicolle]
MIPSVCTALQDVMVYNNVAYPATFMVDKLTYTRDIGCYKDSVSGSFCDLTLAKWRNETNITAAEGAARDCSDCMLGPWKYQLGSPFGYSHSFAEAFSSLTSSCGATGYAFTTPSAYGLNATASSTVATTTSPATTAAASCVRTYTVQANDTCNSIAAALNVSTYNLMNANNINIFCSDLVAGSALCIPEPCNSMTLSLSDTCSSIMEAYSITKAQLLAWNPIIDATCTRIVRWLDWQICTGPPGGYQEASSGTAASAAPVPTNGMTDSNQNCGKWATVGDGDTCASMSVAFGITLSDFYFLNPEVLTDCTNLWLGYAITAPATSFTRPSPTATSYTLGPSTLLPSAPGTVAGCVKYRDHYNSTTFDISGRAYSLDEFFPNDCSYVASAYGVTVDQLLLWNPDLDVDNCELHAGYSYCVLRSYEGMYLLLSIFSKRGYLPSGASIGSGSTRCERVDSTDIMPGTASDCSCYVYIVGSESEDVTCEELAENFSITEEQLLGYNTWIGTTSGSTTTATTVTTLTSTSTSTAPPSASITPMPNITAQCTKYYLVVEGDGCWAIANEHGISTEDFYTWNPAVGTDCSSLWLEYGVCVSIS